MKKIFAIVLAGIMMLSLAACGGTGSSTPAAASSEPAGASGTPASSAPAASTLSGKVTTGGSTSVEKVVGAFIEAFVAENSGVDVTYDPTGSGAGITGAAEGTLDIGLSSRALKDDEAAGGLTATTFALDGIAIIVNSENTVEDLTLEQIKGLATGEITNWSEVGGPDMPVVLVGREAGSGTRDGFESIVDVKDACKYELTSTGAVIAGVAANPNAFGYASLSAVDDTVKAVTVEGVAASEATVQDGTYKIQRPFVFVTKDGAELSEAAQAFIDFATSDAASELIVNAGAVPVAK